jgi:magnesium chelatase family protein
MHAQLQRKGCRNVKLSGGASNAEIANANISEKFLHQDIEQFRFSARSYHKIWSIARTLMNLDEQSTISEAHFMQALNFRSINWEADSI